jgi:hypothetical protein
MRVQPSAGRYFPVTPAEFIAGTEDWPLAEPNVYPPRQLKNPEDDTDPRRLVRLHPRRCVIVYSLPIAVDHAWGKDVMIKALTLLGRWRFEPPYGGHSSRAITVYLQGGTTLRVVDERAKFSSGTYSGVEGSSGPRVTSRTIKELASLELVPHRTRSDWITTCPRRT